jgi:hypothetical protein
MRRSALGIPALLIVTALLASAPAAAQTTVPGGTISTDTTWDLAGSPYVITGNLTIEGTDGADGVTTLTVQPGVEVRMRGYRYLYVGGSSGGLPGALADDGSDEGTLGFGATAERSNFSSCVP